MRHKGERRADTKTHKEKEKDGSMSHTISNASGRMVETTFRSIMLAGVAAFTISAAAPTAALAHDADVSFNGFSFDGDEDLLRQLIELDASDIAELREEMAEAREEIAEAVLEIAEAREEASAAPGGAAIVNVALSAASIAVTQTTNKAFKDAEKHLARAERELDDARQSVGEAEFAETTMAIRVIREEIAEIKIALSELTNAMKA